MARPLPDPSVEGSAWTLDEYAVVADLYLRRRRTSGAGDPDVKELAALTGRSCASISRRMGNFRGTEAPGEGLKPVTGDALALFEQMRLDEEWRSRRVEMARARLDARRSGSIDTSDGESAVGRGRVRFGPIEASSLDGFDVPGSPAQVHRRQEAALVRRYCESLGAGAGSLAGATIDVAGGLRVDLFDRANNTLIEAKPNSSRETIRLLLGQLLDYVRYFDPSPRLVALLPERPVDDLVDLLTSHGITLIFEREGSFETIASKV